MTSSPAANDHCRGINRRAACTYISSSLDADRFEPAYRYSNDGQVTIGWTGTFSTRRYLDLLRGVFHKLAQQRRFRLRVIGNLTRPDGVLAPKSEVERVGIGTRVRMVFTDVVPGLALPQWTIDESAAGGAPWRYRG